MCLLSSSFFAARLVFILLGSATNAVRSPDFICSFSWAEKRVIVGDFFIRCSERAKAHNLIDILRDCNMEKQHSGIRLSGLDGEEKERRRERERLDLSHVRPWASGTQAPNSFTSFSSLPLSHLSLSFTSLSSLINNPV
ncbi:hypothetical protein ACN38_g3031 [Penicillium nordicum]|uniref:Secreted protein n=1 Tax=Penicillium nordicum TaxID=229535 RepID=A0A0M9WIC8_9EURO|nr:hypothetical protein ACN38_g3031 [Penicillium nordicum]